MFDNTIEWILHDKSPIAFLLRGIAFLIIGSVVLCVIALTSLKGK